MLWGGIGLLISLFHMCWSYRWMRNPVSRPWKERPATWKRTMAESCAPTRAPTSDRGRSIYLPRGKLSTKQVKTAITQLKRREEFLQFMDPVVADASPDQERHVILDNYCTRKKCDSWLAHHPNVHFHFTPTSARWLNQVEIWFGILSRKALRGLNAKSISDLRQAIEAFVATYARNPKPFQWRKREVKGSQIRNTIVNLRN